MSPMHNSSIMNHTSEQGTELNGVLKRRFTALCYGLRCNIDTILTVIVATTISHNVAINVHEEVPAPHVGINAKHLEYLIEQGQIPAALLTCNSSINTGHNGSVNEILIPGNTGGGQKVAVKLPTINLPKFNGEYNVWLEFHDTFSSLIHANSEISDIQKFHYLRASLVEGAAQVIAAIEFSEQNYKVAWDILCNRFNNPRLLIKNHVRALFNLETIIKESPSKIRKLIDSYSKHLRSLEQLGQPVNMWDTLVIHLIMTKVDSITIREWEEFKIEREIPTLDQLTKFLRGRAELLDAIENAHKGRLLKWVNFSEYSLTPTFLGKNMWILCVLKLAKVRKVPSKRQAVVDDTKLNLLLALEENPITPARQLARDTPYMTLGPID
ncbi:hypothetical protein NQ318_020399 [Aromia moschata]|uniref:Uncharacterized protein n=1 Tax=Aromia moschata TaxID=1265417 RepID=A0AAV8Y5P5_9CUCU|nr:hypothetical protein NQ318_020399 [Aromia moschata]